MHAAQFAPRGRVEDNDFLALRCLQPDQKPAFLEIGGDHGFAQRQGKIGVKGLSGQRNRRFAMAQFHHRADDEGGNSKHDKRAKDDDDGLQAALACGKIGNRILVPCHEA